jgi:activating signal cointegrator complex subunit 1
MFLFRTRLTADNVQQRQESSPALVTAIVPADMSEPPRVRISESSGRSLPRDPETAKTARKVSGIRAALERSNKRPTTNPAKSPLSPTRQQPSTPRTRTSSHEAEIARLKEEIDKERAMRKAAEARSKHLENEAAALRAELKEKDAHWQEEMRRKIHEARQESSSSNDSVKELHSSRSGSRLAPEAGLQRQLTDLKRSISRSTRVETAVTSDSTFVQEMASLAHQIQNWTVNNYRRARISASAAELAARLDPMLNPRQLDRLKPLWTAWRPENKIFVLQSTVVGILMDVFDDQLLFGMPPHQQWAVSLRKTAHDLTTMLEPQQFDKWRASTLDVVRQTGAMLAATDSAASTMAEYITTTLDVLAGMPSSGMKLASLQPIVRRAIILAHLFRVQRARFSFSLPSPMTAFDPKDMENVAFDRDAEEGHPIDCATFPLVLKLGDEHGSNLQCQNVLLKANVVCGES